MSFSTWEEKEPQSSQDFFNLCGVITCNTKESIFRKGMEEVSAIKKRNYIHTVNVK